MQTQAARGEQLAQHGAQLQLSERGPNAKGGEFIVAVLHDFVVAFAAQHVHRVLGAKVDAAGLIDAVDGR